MTKNYVDDKDMERKDETKLKDIYEKDRTGYIDGENPSMKDKEQHLPGDEIVEDLRELSRQQGQKGGNPPDFVSGENFQQETDRPRYGGSTSIDEDKEFQKKDKDSSSEWQNEKNYQNSN